MRYLDNHLFEEDLTRLKQIDLIVSFFRLLVEKHSNWDFGDLKFNLKFNLKHHDLIKQIIARPMVTVDDIIFYTELTKDETKIVRDLIKNAMDIKIRPFSCETMIISLKLNDQTAKYVVEPLNYNMSIEFSNDPWWVGEDTWFPSLLDENDPKYFLGKIFEHLTTSDLEYYDNDLDKLMNHYHQLLCNHIVNMIRKAVGIK